MAIKHLLVGTALLAISFAQRCPYQFEGRVPKGSTPATFDNSASNYNTDYVRGAGKKSQYFVGCTSLLTLTIGLTWSQIIQLPTLPTSLVHSLHSFLIFIFLIFQPPAVRQKYQHSCRHHYF